MGDDPVGGREIGLHGRNAPAVGRQAERDAAQRPGLSTDERHRLKQLERKNFELKRVNAFREFDPVSWTG